jgi:hypothetical protein
MPSQIGKLKYVALVLLLIGCGLSVAYGVFYGIPKKKCDAQHGWFSFKYQTCKMPLQIVNPIVVKPAK